MYSFKKVQVSIDLHTKNKKHAKNIVCTLNFRRTLVYVSYEKIIFCNNAFENTPCIKVAYIIIKIFHIHL